MERRAERVGLNEDQELAGMGSRKDTDGGVGRESQLQISIVLSNRNGLCAPRSEAGGQFGGCD